MYTDKRLDKLMTDSPVLAFDENTSIVIMSDCHRGIGNWGDNFLKNQNLFFAALTYYDKEGFTYIELGDGDELWENRDMEQIIQIHSNCFWLMAKLYRENRFHMLYGNHDWVKHRQPFLSKTCDHYFCETSHRQQPLFPGLIAQESLLLTDTQNGWKILLAHGHQGDLLNDRFRHLARFLVRYFWRPLELLGLHDPTSAAKNYRKKNAVEKRLSNWAAKNRQPLVAGHTHRPMLPAPDEVPYFNSGSCVHPRCITALEIQNLQITLVKWSVQTRSDLTLCVDREILEGPYPLADYFSQEQYPESSL